MCQKEPSKAWNAQHSMIPTVGRDVTKVTPIGTNVSKRTVQGMECAAFHDPDSREGRDEGHAHWHVMAESLLTYGAARGKVSFGTK
jgi:hypothetical protein